MEIYKLNEKLEFYPKVFFVGAVPLIFLYEYVFGLDSTPEMFLAGTFFLWAPAIPYYWFKSKIRRLEQSHLEQTVEIFQPEEALADALDLEVEDCISSWLARFGNGETFIFPEMTYSEAFEEATLMGSTQDGLNSFEEFIEE